MHPQIKKIRQKTDDINAFRGSKFRGISKNGRQWQVLFMQKRKKNYLGIIKHEIDAARFYDTVVIQN